MKVTVLLGGTSAERDVSMSSGLRVVQALRERGYRVRSVDPATGELTLQEEERLRSEGVKKSPPSLRELVRLSWETFPPSLVELEAVYDSDVLFLALHGGHGEDGTLQALFDLAGLIYTGSGHIGSALAWDKELSKELMRARGVPTPDWLMAPVRPEQVAKELGYPVVVKPSKQGSTVGLTIVRGEEELAAAVSEAFRYDNEVMVEKFIPGRELTVGVLGDEALPVGEIIPVHEIYDYECKYTPGMAREEFPAALSEADARTLQEYSLTVFRALKLRGCARIDFRMAPDGSFYCLEANTLPGLTPLSLIPQAALAAGISFPELCERIVKLAMEDPDEWREGDGG